LTLTTTGTSGAATLIGNTLNIPQYTDQFVGTVTSVGLSMPIAFTVSNSPVTSSGTLTVVGAGTASQYVRGDGTLGDFPGGGGGGGSSVSYYLNGSINQGTFVGNTYYEMSKTPVFGAGTDFSINTDGYIAQFITDANDPESLLIPGGNWNLEIYFSASSGGGSPTFYVELYKYDGTAFTLIASNSTNPELISLGTTINPYFSTLGVPETVLSTTDRLAIRIYVTNAGRTITLHTENSHLCQIITTFANGLTALNGLTRQVQYFQVGTSGTDFNIASSVATHTFNLPTATSTIRGALSSADWITFNGKQNAITLTTTGTTGAATLIGSTLNIPNYSTDLSGYVTLDTTQTITGLKTILRGGDVLNFKIGTDTIYGLKVAYNQNELVPSGEATWSFVNTFNRNGSGFSVTPLSFFRGVLVTGERLLSASVNTNLLDYYANNPTGRYPIYAYNTGVQQFASSIIVGETNGVVDAITGSIADLPAGVVANFKGRVIGSNAVNNNEFATLGQVTSTSRAAISLTTTGSSGPATYNNVTGVLNIPEYAGTVNPSAREIQTYIATASQTTFTVTGGYTVGLVDVFINGVRLTSSDYTATNGTTVVLAVGTMAGNIVDIIKYTSGIVNSISGSGTTNELAYFTASTTIASLSTATYPSLTELSYVKGVTSSIQTQLNGKQNALTNPVTGTGTTNYLPKFTGSTTIGNSNIQDSGTLVTVGVAAAFSSTISGSYGATFVIPSESPASGNVALVAKTSNGANDIFRWFDGATTLGVFKNNGNILIGTTTDAGYKLDVNGTGRFSGALTGTSATWSNINVFTGALVGAGSQRWIGSDGGAGLFLNTPSGSNLNLAINNNPVLGIASTGAATFSSSVTAGGNFGSNAANTSTAPQYFLTQTGGNTYSAIGINRADGTGIAAGIGSALVIRSGDATDFPIQFATANNVRLTITSGGNVLIGTTSDNGNKMQVNGFISMLANPSSGASFGVRFSNNNGTYWELRNADAFNKFNFIYQGSLLADINSSSGAYTALSDINKKKDFEESTIGLNEILGLKPTLYRMKSDNETSDKHLGFIAQEVKEFIPQAYVENGDFIGLQDRPIIAALVKSVQELKAELDELKSKN